MRYRAQVALVAGVIASMAAGALAVERSRSDRPSLRVTATPPMGVAPLKVSFKADLRGGDDDDEEFYCASVEWDWGDDSISEWSRDCAPYKAGVSRIERHFTAQHQFRYPGVYQVKLRLKRGSKVLTAVTTPVEVVGHE